MLPPLESLERLVEGNRRARTGHASVGGSGDIVRAGQLAEGQEPFAVVLGCSDSRVPVETVFGQGPGDLFVVRVAGNVALPSQIGSVEFAVAQLGTRLVVVLGHSRCGAVGAALAERWEGSRNPSGNLRAVLDRIHPALAALPEPGPDADREALAREAIRANVRASVRGLREESEILGRSIRGGEVVVVGAEYSLETGAVEFFEGVPDSL